jgi:hypothetical protein
LLPNGVVPLTLESLEREAQLDQVEGGVGKLFDSANSEQGEEKTARIQHHLASSRQRAAALDRLGSAWASGSICVTEDIVKRSSEQGWVLRSLERREREAIQVLREEAANQDRLAAFIAEVTAIPPDGKGGWCESAKSRCKFLGREPTAEDVAMVIKLALKSPDDLRIQETACEAMVNAAAQPEHFNPSKAHAALATLLNSEGLTVLLAAAHNHRSAERLQKRVCQAVWHITDTSRGARAAQAAGAVEVMTSAMMRFPREKTLQRSAIAALANIAKHLEDVVPDAFLREAVGSVSFAMASFPAEVELHAHACTFLWQLAARDFRCLAQRPGMQGLLERSAAVLGVREAQWLLECVRWQTPAEAQTSRGADRRRWGQWATGRRVPA